MAQEKELSEPLKPKPLAFKVRTAKQQMPEGGDLGACRETHDRPKRGKVWGKGISQNVVWYVVRDCCKGMGLEHIAPHDLRRTCAKLCHSGGGELEQIQFLLGHASVQTTERYLG